MFEIGEVVYHDNFVFNDGDEPDKKQNRPCIVLFNFTYNGKSMVCTCPLTSNISSFNKHPNKYIFIPEIIYHQRTLSFLNLENIYIHEEMATHKTDIHVSKEVIDNIVLRFREYNPKNEKLQPIYDDIIRILDYIELFDQLNDDNPKMDKKKEKVNKRRLAKRKNG